MVLFWASANMPERAVRMVMAIWMIMRQVSGGSFFFIMVVVRLFDFVSQYVKERLG